MSSQLVSYLPYSKANKVLELCREIDFDSAVITPSQQKLYSRDVVAKLLLV